MKRLILAMSRSRHDVSSHIEDHTKQVIVALTQLYLFPYGARDHWRKEVWEKFYEVQRFKGSNKLPSKRFILENSWQVHKNQLNNIVKFVISKEDAYEPRRDMDTEELSNIVSRYFDWLADYLSKNDFVPKSDVLLELDKLGLTA